MQDLSGKKLCFISDLHLGMPGHKQSLERERLVVRWLDEIAGPDCVIFLLGDIFDFWYEWKHVVPRGFTRFLGKIGQLTDQGIDVRYFTGNHDVWVWNYLPAETGIKVHKEPLQLLRNGQRLYIAHGDGLGHYDKQYNFLKKIFTNPVLQWLFSRLHPSFAVDLARLWSGQSRKKHSQPHFLGPDKEWLILHSQDIEQQTHHDFYVYGHRHLPGKIALSPQSTYINTGDWVTHFTYAVLDDTGFTLYSYSPVHEPLKNQYIHEDTRHL